MKIAGPKIIVGFLFLGLVGYSCTYDKEDEYYIEITCDTLDVTFSENVGPIIQSNCLSCHNGPGGNGGVDLSSYDKVKKYADNGKLLGAIRHEKGYSPMPKSQNKLDECNIRQIEIWIGEGTLNN